jgi:hypothetical protein
MDREQGGDAVDTTYLILRISTTQVITQRSCDHYCTTFFSAELLLTAYLGYVNCCLRSGLPIPIQNLEE